MVLLSQCMNDKLSLILMTSSAWTGGGGGGRGARANPSPSQKKNNSVTLKVPFLLSKSRGFKVKHTPVLLRKRAFSSIFKSLNANCLPLTGHSKISQAQTKLGKGAPLIPRKRAFITVTFAAPSSNGGTGSIISPVNDSHCHWRGTVEGGGMNQRTRGACSPKITTPKRVNMFTLIKECQC